jgi:hypothetical protein
VTSDDANNGDRVRPVGARGILVFIPFDIVGGPLITTLKWVANAAVLGSVAHTWVRRKPRVH